MKLTFFFVILILSSLSFAKDPSLNKLYKAMQEELNKTKGNEHLYQNRAPASAAFEFDWQAPGYQEAKESEDSKKKIHNIRENTSEGVGQKNW